MPSATGCIIYSSLPSSSTTTSTSEPSSSSALHAERRATGNGRVRKSTNDVLKRRALLRMAARRVKWAKRTAAMRDVRMQIDKEFENMVSENKRVMERLSEDNKALKAATSDAISKCASLLSTVQSLTSGLTRTAPLHCEWSVPRSGSESPDSSDDFYESAMPVFDRSLFLIKPHLSKC